MPLILFTASFAGQSNPRVLPAGTPAVLAGHYIRVEEDAGNPGGVTRGDIASADIRTLGECADGQDVYVESDATDDVLDDTDDETSVTSRIWWRATVLER